MSRRRESSLSQAITGAGSSLARRIDTVKPQAIYPLEDLTARLDRARGLAGTAERWGVSTLPLESPDIIRSLGETTDELLGKIVAEDPVVARLLTPERVTAGTIPFRPQVPETYEQYKAAVLRVTGQEEGVRTPSFPALMVASLRGAAVHSELHAALTALLLADGAGDMQSYLDAYRGLVEAGGTITVRPRDYSGVRGRVARLRDAAVGYRAGPEELFALYAGEDDGLGRILSNDMMRALGMRVYIGLTAHSTAQVEVERLGGELRATVERDQAGLKRKLDAILDTFYHSHSRDGEGKVTGNDGLDQQVATARADLERVEAVLGDPDVAPDAVATALQIRAKVITDLNDLELRLATAQGDMDAWRALNREATGNAQQQMRLIDQVRATGSASLTDALSIIATLRVAHANALSALIDASMAERGAARSAAVAVYAEKMKDIARRISDARNASLKTLQDELSSI